MEMATKKVASLSVLLSLFFLAQNLIIPSTCSYIPPVSSYNEINTTTSSNVIENPYGGISVPIRPVYKSYEQHLRDLGTSPPYRRSGGAYAIGLTIGNTAQTLYCNFDTGSFDLFVAGPDCSNCIEAPTSYVPSSDYYSIQTCSSRFCTANGRSTDNFCQANRCRNNATYGDGSGVTANIVNDRIGIPGLSKQANVSFGSIVREYSGNTGITFLTTNQSGLIGSGYVTGSRFPSGNSNPGTVMDMIANANGLTNVFSLCVRKDNPFMSLGADFYGLSGFTYTPNVENIYFQINIQDIVLKTSSYSTSLGLTTSEYNNGRVIIDSGTTLAYLDSNLFDVFYETLISLCSNGVTLKGVCGVSRANSIFSKAYTLSAAELAAYPTVSIKVPCSSTTCNTLDLPSQYWLLQNGPPGDYSAYFVDSGKRAGTILGDIWMNNFHVVFDKSRSLIGFAPQSTCSLSGAKLNGTASGNSAAPSTSSTYYFYPNDGASLSSDWIDLIKN